MSDDSFRVALTDGLRHERVVEHRQPLDAIGATLDVVPAPTSDEEAVERLSGYQGVIFSHGHYQLHTFDQLPDLVGVIAPTVGVDHVDIQAATAAGVVVGNIPTFATEQTADTTLYLMLGAVRRIPRILNEWEAGHRGIAEWERRIDHIGDMRASTLALIGLGRIGRAVAVRAQAFGTRCIAYAPTVSPWEAQGLGVELVGLHEAVEQADIVSDTPALHTSYASLRGRGPVGADEAHGGAHQRLARADRGRSGAGGGAGVRRNCRRWRGRVRVGTADARHAADQPAERDLDPPRRRLHLGQRPPRRRGRRRTNGLDRPGLLAPRHHES